MKTQKKINQCVACLASPLGYLHPSRVLSDFTEVVENLLVQMRLVHRNANVVPWNAMDN